MPISIDEYRRKKRLRDVKITCYSDLYQEMLQGTPENWLIPFIRDNFQELVYSRLPVVLLSAGMQKDIGCYQLAIEVRDLGQQEKRVLFVIKHLAMGNQVEKDLFYFYLAFSLNDCREEFLKAFKKFYQLIEGSLG